METAQDRTPEQILVAALRSGEYTQGRDKLTMEGRDCCLGVACKVYQQVVGDLEILAGRVTNYHPFHTTYDGERNYLPAKVQTWLGWEHPEGTIYPAHRLGASLADMNDHGASFLELADVIEAGQVSKNKET